MGKSSRRKEQCVYCGEIGPITWDHVPPKNLFPKPRPHNLIKVPSCVRCNKDASDDDEYFRMMLALRADVYHRQDVKQVLGKVMRSLINPHKVGLQNSFFRNIRSVDIYIKGDLLVGKAGAYDVDLRRLDRVAERTTKGLFYHENGVRLPDCHSVVAFSEAGLWDLDEENIQTIKTEVLPALYEKEPKVIGLGTFAYRVAYADADPTCSAWLLTFYTKINFLCLITPD